MLIEYPKKDIFALAFVTRLANWGELDARLEDLLLVFVPTTPNPTSGFLLLVPRKEAIELPVSVEEGVRMVISGGILLPTPQLAKPTLPRVVGGAEEAVLTAAGTSAPEDEPGTGTGS